MSHWEAMLSHPNEWVEQWHILRPDADFRNVTKSNEDTLHTSGSYDVTRSSPDDDGETSDDDGGDDQRLQDKDIGPEPVLAFSDVEPIAAVNQGFQSGGAAVFPPPNWDKDKHQFKPKELTEEIDGETATPVMSSGEKKVSLHMSVLHMVIM